MVENHQHARLGPVAGPLVMLLIVCCSFWRITLAHGDYTWLDSPDLAEQVLPWLQYEADTLHGGRVPLWDPHEGGGQSLIGQMQPGVVNPVNWLLFAMPLDGGFLSRRWVDAYFILIHYLAGLFCYLLCRDLGRSTLGSVFGGSAFALGGWIGYTDWPQMLSGGIWAPLVFLFLFRAYRGIRFSVCIRNAALSGGFLGLAFLSGHHQIPIFTGLAAAGCWVWYLFQGQDRRAPERWYAVAAFCVMTGLVGAAQILPASDYGRHAVRWVGANNPVGWKEVVPYRVLERYSLPPAGILSLVVRDLSDNSTAYVGWGVLLMAVAGAIAAWREVPARLLAIVAAGGMLLAMGSETVFHGILYALIPEFNKARTIAFAVFLSGFGAAVLAAYGLDRFLEVGLRVRRVLALMAATGGVLCIASPWILFQTKLPKTQDYNMTSFFGLVALGVALVLAAWSAGKLRRPAVALAALSLVELGSGIGYGYQRSGRPDSLLTKLTEHAEIACWLKHRAEPVRAEIDSGEIPYNFCDWYGIDTIDVLIPSLTTNIESVRFYYWARMLLGVNYYIGRKPLRPGQTDEFTDSRGVKIFGNPDAFPRVWVVHKTALSGNDGIGYILDHMGPALRDTAVFPANAPALEKCAGDSVNMFRRDADSLEFEVNMACRGLAIAGENYDPGWRVQVDGRSAPLIEVDGVARGVVLPAGKHRVAMRYRPGSVTTGAVLTGVGVLAMLGVAFL
jgi:hypothetical protein